MDEWTYRKLLGGHSNLSNYVLLLELINNNSMAFLSFGWEKVVTLHNHDILLWSRCTLAVSIMAV